MKKVLSIGFWVLGKEKNPAAGPGPCNSEPGTRYFPMPTSLNFSQVVSSRKNTIPGRLASRGLGRDNVCPDPAFPGQARDRLSAGIVNLLQEFL